MMSFRKSSWCCWESCRRFNTTRVAAFVVGCGRSRSTSAETFSEKRTASPSRPFWLILIWRKLNDTDLLTQQEYRDHLANSALLLMKKHFSETSWQACWEHVANGRPASEVATELGISVNAVYLARGRVLRRLKQELAGLWE